MILHFFKKFSAINFVLYLIFSFIAYNFNPFEWILIKSSIGCVLLGLYEIILIFIILSDEKENIQS